MGRRKEKAVQINNRPVSLRAVDFAIQLLITAHEKVAKAIDILIKQPTADGVCLVTLGEKGRELNNGLDGLIQEVIAAEREIDK